MLRTIGLITTLALGLLAAPVPAEAQQSGKVALIGFLSAGPGASRTPLKEGLRELGYVEGQHFNIVNRGTYGKTEQYPKFVTELIRLKVDVIVAANVTAALAAKKVTSTIPIVVVFVSLVAWSWCYHIARCWNRRRAYQNVGTAPPE